MKLENYEVILTKLTKEVNEVDNKPTALVLYGTLAVWIHKTLTNSDPNIRDIGYKLTSLQYKLADLLLH